MSSKPSIKELGFKGYIDATAYKHKRNDYVAWVKLKDICRHPNGEINLSMLARAMDVKDERTIINWLEVDGSENGNDSV